MKEILFRSTNRQAEQVSFKEALLKGQAPDYGLYVPISIPELSREKIKEFARMPYYQIAFQIARMYISEEDFPSSVLLELCRQAYNFPVPLRKVDRNLFVLYLDKGPTASFKDFAARLMARMMDYIASKENRNLTVLVATSGDTGGAIADAFFGLGNINVVVLFPEKEVTGRQRKQMTTLRKNIWPIAVKGTFDDCQAIVKRAFNDPCLRGKNLTSANSINFGRLLPQSVYYFKAYCEIAAEKVVFSVPSGNFGNLMGGVLAREMGLPVEKFIVAVNENDEFPRFLETGIYKPVFPSRKCSSNAMNVGHPSNLARLIDLYGGWLTDERDTSGKVIRKGVLKKPPDMDLMRKHFVSFSINDSAVDDVIREVYKKYNLLIEPHGAISIAAALKSGLDVPVCCFETADPAKFPEKIKQLLNFEPPVPDHLKKIDDKEENFIVIENDYENFVEAIP